MTIKSKIKKIVLSFIVLTMTAAVTYYADSPTMQSVSIASDLEKS